MMSTQVSNSFWLRSWKRLQEDRLGMLGLWVIGVYLITSVLVSVGWAGANWADFVNPDGYSSPTRQWWFGTNFNGQDIFERSIYSVRTAFQIGFIVSTATTVIGAVLGGIAGYFTGTWIDELVLWVCGVLDTIPYILLVSIIGFLIPDSPITLYTALIVTSWVGTCKSVRALAMQIKNFGFIESAEALGSSSFRIISRHILPNTLSLLLIELTIGFVAAIKAEVVLSYLGLGIKDGVSWGLMLSEAVSEVVSGHFGNFIAASGLLSGLVMAFNIFADGLQDAFDPNFQKSTSA